jgi:Zn-dependent alcohol dehydrogenase
LSEYSLVSENRVTVVPENTNPEVCALLGCSLTTALGVINNDAQVKFGESVLIIGCGGVGLNLIQGAKLAGAYPIIVVDVSDEKEQVAKSLGCSHYVNVKKSNISDVVGKGGVDNIIDTTGNPSAIKVGLPLLADSGKFIMVGHPTKGNDTVEIMAANHMFSGKGKTIKASQGGQTNPDVDIPRYVKLFNAGLLNVESMITNRFSLDQINDAIEELKSGKAGRIIIKCHE